MDLDELAQKLGFPKLILFPVYEKGENLMMEFGEVENSAEKSEKELKALLGCLQEVEENLIDTLEKHHLSDWRTLELFTHGEISIYRFSSNVGSYIALCYNRAQIPPSPGWFGRSFYVHNDFNCPARYLSVPEALELAQKLPEYLKFFNGRLLELKNKAEGLKKALAEQDKLQ